MINYVLFDLGNILIEIGRVPWFSDSTAYEQLAYKKWIETDAVKNYESGKISTEAFFAAAPAVLNMSREEFTNRFDSWLVGEYAGATELVRRLKEDYRVGCLSNTSPFHMEKVRRQSNLLDGLDDCFLSYEMGAVKPGKEIYEMVLQQVNLPANEILFLDDNKINVDTAEALGFTAVWVKGFGPVKDALREHLQKEGF